MDCTRKKRPTRQKDFSAIAVPSMSGMGYLEYTIESHASRALNAMDEFRRDEMLCDLVLHVTQKERTVDFKVHKLVLASCSPYFRAMFTSSFKEGRASEVTLRDVCPLVVGKLIDFAYTARITVGDKCVLHILLGIGCTDLHQHSREYINTHFNEVEEFFNLTHCQLLELISLDSIKVLCESEVYKACTDWVRWDVEGRAQYLHALLNAVHIYALPPKFLKNQLQSCPILSKDNCCKDFLSKIFQEMALKKPRPPAPLRGNQLIYVAGGFHDHSLPTMEAYDPGRNVWLKLADMGAPCSGLGACVVFGLFYTVGGKNLSDQTNTESSALCCYNPMTNCWSQLASLNSPRNRVGVAVVDGAIYAVGGSQGSVHHDTVERWDPETNRWTFVRPMVVARLGAGVAACGGALYVVGGYDGQNRWKTADRYQPDTNTWHPLAPMSIVRSGLGLVCLDAYLYAVGGFDGQSQLCSTERYSIARNHWEAMAPMHHCRSAHAVTVYHGRIFVLGQSASQSVSLASHGMGIAVTMEPCPGNLAQQEEEEEEEQGFNMMNYDEAFSYLCVDHPNPPNHPTTSAGPPIERRACFCCCCCCCCSVFSSTLLLLLLL
ncbi:hypothetical protein CRUP_033872 [Coryphaenoides rupestris]|nr:hypothetical protein CRUP_033872 [Coryphaenoides rupestris]